MARDTCKSNNCQLLQSSKDTCNNKVKSVGPLSLSMVSSKRTGGAIDGFIEGRQRGNREHVGPLPLSMVSSKGAGALSIVSSKEVGNREHHSKADMSGISTVICRREGVASIVFVLWLILS